MDAPIDTGGRLLSEGTCLQASLERALARASAAVVALELSSVC